MMEEKETENTVNSIMSESMEPEGGDMTRNDYLPVEEAKIKEIEEKGSESLKRNPTVVIVGPDHKFAVQSRYRRVSLASCHDLCKFGHEHEPEKMTKRPLLGTIKESRPVATKNNSQARSVSVSGRPSRERVPPISTKGRNSPVRSTRSQSAMKRLQSESSVVRSAMKRVPSESSVVRSAMKRVPSESLVVRSAMKRVPSESSVVPTSGNIIRRSKTDSPAVKKTLSVSINRKIENKTKETCSSSGNRKVKAKEPVSTSPRVRLEKSSSCEGTVNKNTERLSSSRCQSNLEDSKIIKSCVVPEKAVYVVQSNAVSAGKALRSSLFDEDASSTWSSIRSTRSSIRSARSSTRSSRRASQVGTPKKVTSPDGRWVYRPKGENRQKSEPINSKVVDIVTNESGSKTNISRAKKNPSLQTKGVEEKEGSVWKVKFRKGTVVNSQVANNSVRKLRFKRGRILENQNAEVVAGKSLKSGDYTKESPDIRPETKKVLLRRQETAGKRDSIDLNNVIEETASKLVKTRKSKVKALVGAFETVMSFRDREPLPENSASEPLPENSAFEPLPETSASELLPETSASELLPETSASEPLPETSASEPLPETSASESLPETSASESLPETSASESLPETSAS